MKKTLWVILFSALFITACAPSAVIKEALEEKPTQTTIPTETQPPPNTPTETLTQTPSETPTEPPTITPTPDLRIIAEEPRSFLMEKADLPSDAHYYIPGQNWMTPHLNKEILYDWGNTQGQEYINTTGRITGWIVYHKRGSDFVSAPEELFHNIVQYETVDGPIITMTEFAIDTRGDFWTRLDRDIDIGDLSIAYLSRESQAGGRFRVFYRVYTAYRNYLSVVHGYGWEEDVNYDFVDSLAQKMVDKLKDAPLEP